MRNNFPVLNVYKKKTKKSSVVTQLLYGDTFKKLAQYGSWIKIKNNSDNYKGYIIKKKFFSDHTNTHKISVLFSSIYKKPNNKSKINNKLGFGSRIKVVDKKNNFYKFDDFWIKKNGVKKIKFKNKNLFKNIDKFINVKYKWGGKHFTGVDCSGLIQLYLNFNNKHCPRDSKDQFKYFKKKIDLSKIKKNDLIFWKGHVAVATSRNRLIHAYGPLKKVISMPIKETITRIYKTANLKVTGIRRIT